MVDREATDASSGDGLKARSRQPPTAGRGPAGGAAGPAAGTPHLTRGRLPGGPDDAPPVEVDALPAGVGRRPWRWLRWPWARPRRPAWWEVPPYGYLEVEARNGPTRPHALRALAKAAVHGGLAGDTGRPLPVQRFVQAHERARLHLHARRELPRVTAVASQVMATDSRLADAEDDLQQAASRRATAAAAARRAADRPGASTGDGQVKVTGVGAPPPSPVAGTRLAQPHRRPVLGPWAEAVILAMLAGGQAALAYVAARDLGLGPLPLGLLTLAAAVCSVAAAQLASRAIERVGTAADGFHDPHRRRWLDVAVGAGALACGVALAVGVGRLAASAAAGLTVPADAGPGDRVCTGCAGLLASQVIVLGLALLGLATAVSYAAIPDAADPTVGRRWRLVVARVRRFQQSSRSRRRLRAALAQEAAAQLAVRQLREELAVLVPQLFAAEQGALLFWRYQVAIGDAAQHTLEQYLAGFTLRRSKGVGRPIREWWYGAEPVTPRPERFTSIGEAQEDWAEQVARVTMAAKRVLVRRGLLDITHSLRLSRPPATPPADPEGAAAVPAGTSQEVVARDAHDRAMLPPPVGGQRGERP